MDGCLAAVDGGRREERREEGGERESGDGETLPKDQKATNCCNTKHQNKTKRGGFVCQHAERKKEFEFKKLFYLAAQRYHR